MAKKNSARFTSSTFKTSFGLFLGLLSLFCLLSPLTRLGYVQWPVFCLFGLSGHILIGAILFECGLHGMLHAKWKPFSARIRLGMFFLLLGLWALAGALTIQLVPNALDLPYIDDLNEAFRSNRHSLYSNYEYLSGLLGNLAFGHLASAVGGLFVGYIIGGTVTFCGLLLLCWPLLCFLLRKWRTGHAIRKARRDKAREEQALRDSLDFVIEGEDGPVPAPKFDEEPLPPAPGLSFPEQTKTEAEEEAPTLKNSYTFAPAGGSTLPSRKSLRVEHAAAPVMAESETPSPYAPTSPRQMPNPDRSLYAANPVRSSGLREAFFLPNGAEEEIEETKREEQAKEESRQSLKEIMPSFLGGPVAPEVPPDELEEIEEEPATPFAPEAASTIVIDNSSDEEEYVPPSNDPIPLMPSEGLIIGGEEEEEAEPEVAPVVAPSPVPQVAPVAPQTEPEPAPVVDEDEIEKPRAPYVFPDASLLSDVENTVSLEDQQAECAIMRENIDKVFGEFRVGAHVADVLVGPSITRYSIELDPGVSIQNIARIIPDMEVRLGGVSIRFAERVFGSPYCAIELANTERRTVSFKELFVAMPPRKDGPDLKISFGLDIAGQLKCADLAKFPHMLIAGTSGSGKSIFAHSLLMALIMRNHPEDLKLVLIDPKRGVEMARYKDMPHLLCPIIKEPIPAKNALKKLVELMNERYRKLEASGTTDIKEYNKEYAIPEGKKRMPYIVCFVDEFADIVGECKDIMEYVNILAAKARSCGIHVVVATQRPDVKVITGTLKSNLACRVALTVSKSVDSVTILGEGGAESLYGYGDMLIDCQELSKREFVRAQGCLTTLREGRKVCDFIRAQLPPNYDKDFLDLEDHDDEGPEVRDGGYAPIQQMQAGPTPAEIRNASNEEKYIYIRSAIMGRDTCSISMIQRDFEVGFPRAGKILSRLQKEGVVAQPSDSPNSSKGCRVLVHSEEELAALLAQKAQQEEEA